LWGGLRSPMENNNSPNMDSRSIQNSWDEYKRHVLNRLKDLKELETKVENLRIDFAVLKSHTAIISAGIALVLSIGIPFVLRLFTSASGGG